MINEDDDDQDAKPRPKKISRQNFENDHRVESSNVRAEGIWGGGAAMMEDSTSLASLELADDDDELFGKEFIQNAGRIPDEADSMLAQTMGKLSMEDRERVYYDLHGVTTPVEETPTFINEQLNQIREELIALTDGAEAYRIALHQNPGYVLNPEFLLKFLRADRFDAKLAAGRIAKYFELKLELFPEHLVEDILYDHLNSDDVKALHDGVSYDLPVRDRAGRVIYFQLAQPMDLPFQAIKRKMFYAFSVVAEDVETQKKGMVYISYLVGVGISWQELIDRMALSRFLGTVAKTMPIRVEAIHVCFDSILWRSLVGLSKLSVSRWNLVRVREHFGNHSEVLFELQTFGISGYLFPITSDGEVLRHLCVERWQKRQMLESLRKSSAATELEKEQAGESSKKTAPTVVHVETPNHNDVLLGRGKSCYLHLGNVRMRNLVVETRARYESASYTDKHQVVVDIVKSIKQSGRFLESDGFGWVEVDDELAEKKVASALRTLRGLRKQEDSSTNFKRPIEFN